MLHPDFPIFQLFVFSRPQIPLYRRMLELHVTNKFESSENTFLFIPILSLSIKESPQPREHSSSIISQISEMVQGQKKIP
jgi:hypothetical protein